MAIAVDASSPARVTSASTSTATSTAFNPPAGLLLVCANGNSGSGQSVTAAISNNGTALTWTQIDVSNFGSSAQSGHASMHWAQLTTGRTGMTVSLTLTGTGPIPPSIKVYVLTGADTGASPIGGHTKGGGTTNNTTTTGFTASATGSLGFACGTDWQELGTPTSSDMTFEGFDSAGNISGGSGRKSLGSAGSTVTFNLDAAGTSAAAWNWVSAEVKAAVGGGTTQNADASLTATATISASAQSTKSADGSLNVTATVTGSGASDKPIGGAVASTATIAAGAIIGAAPQPADSAVTSSTSITATASVTRGVSASVGAGCTITATATVVRAGITGDAAVQVGVTIIADATVVRAAERVWRLIPPQVIEEFPIVASLRWKKTREVTVFGNDETLNISNEGAIDAGGDEYGSIPFGTKYIWFGGHINVTSDPAIRDLWIESGFEVEQVT